MEAARIISKLLTVVTLLMLLACSGSDTETADQPEELSGETAQSDGINQELRTELMAMADRDQQARQKMMQSQFEDSAVIAEVMEIDRENTQRMQEIIAEYGWPGRSLVGDSGVSAAWMIVQHADQNPPFQKECLELMRQAEKEGEIDGRSVAMLTDRVRLHEDKPQLYGTQFEYIDGDWVPLPIEDSINVDARRAELGMMPLDEYKELLHQVYQTRQTDQPNTP